MAFTAGEKAMSLEYCRMESLRYAACRDGQVECRDSRGKGRSLGEVDGRAGDVVEVVRGDGQGYMGHDRSDLGVPVARVPHGGDVRIFHHTPLRYHRPDKAKQDVGPWVGGIPSPTVGDILIAQSGPLANGRVCRYTY